MRSVRGNHTPVSTLMIEGTLMESTPGGVLKKQPDGHPITMRTLDPGTSLVNWAAMTEFLRRCPNPNPSWEYIITRTGSPFFAGTTMLALLRAAERIAD
jgi:hypothetical protein